MKSFIATIIQTVFTLVMYALGTLIMGLALFPGGLLCYKVFVNMLASPLMARILYLCFAISGAYFLYGLSLILLVGIFRFVFRLKLKEGEYHIISLGAVKWAMANALVLVVSVTFMDFILLTPFAALFYRLMGAKVGKNVQINSKYCADLSLLEIDDGAVIGGHATVIGHSFERNRLILKKVKIGRKAIVGLNSVILPGTEIGDKALVAAGVVLGKNTIVEPRSVYRGKKE